MTSHSHLRRVALFSMAPLIALALTVSGLSAAEPVPVLVEVEPAPEAAAPRGGGGLPIYLDDFESGLGGWTVTDLSGNGTQWGITDCWAAGGAFSAGAIAGGTSPVSCEGTYPAFMKTWMIYGPFSLDPEGYVEWAEMTFDYTADTEEIYDGLVVAASSDGVHFSGIQYDGLESGSGVLDLTDLIDQDEVWVGFQFSSDHADARQIGAAVDNVSIRRAQAILPNDVYAWTISDSDTDPYSTRGEPSAGLTFLYLWYTCAHGAAPPVAAMQAHIALYPGVPLTFNSTNGFLNAGTEADLLLVVGGCPGPPVVAGSFICIDEGEGIQMCLEPYGTDPYVTTVDCADNNGYESYSIGYSSRAEPAPCIDPICGTGPVSVEPTSWGRIKTLYRDR